jgi:hypothetical protein
MAVSKQTSFEVEGVPDDLLAPMVHALSDMRCYKFGREGLMVTARTPINWRSVGEIMSVRLSEAGVGRTLVEAASHSALRTVIFDWGKNDYNLRRFEAAFHARLAQQVAKAE